MDDDTVAALVTTLTAELAALKTVEDRVSCVLGHARRTLDADAAELVLLDEAGQPRLAAVIDADAAASAARPDGDVASSDPVAGERAESHPGATDPVGGEPGHAELLTAPVAIVGVPAGELSARVARGRAWTRDDRALLQAFAALTAAVLVLEAGSPAPGAADVRGSGSWTSRRAGA